MPHIVVEYSANLEKDLDIAGLVDKVHEAVLASGVFELGAVRTRAERRDVYRIADGDPDNGFVHVDLRIAPGRDGATRKRVAEAVLDVVASATRQIFARSGLGLSVEVREIDNSAAVRLNNLHERMAAKGAARRAAS
jgi:5-carboxymethyl-2-hydroxymuconate isomerase